MAEQASISIRPYRPEDRGQVMALAPRLTERAPAWRDPDALLAAARGWVSGSLDAISKPYHAAYVAADGDSVVGVITVGERTHFTGQVDAYVGELVVKAGMERRGIATELMAAAESWGSRPRPGVHHAGDRGRDQPARLFYATVGYQEEEVRLTKAVPAAT